VIHPRANDNFESNINFKGIKRRQNWFLALLL